jgi:GNAT superfamily N-acetyltransferase
VITFARETVAQIRPDMAPLIEEHWRALARNQDLVPLDVDWGLYEAIESRGGLVVVSARDEAETGGMATATGGAAARDEVGSGTDDGAAAVRGQLVGYAVYMVRAHPHYRSTLFANADLFWITPGARGVGVGKRLFAFVEAELRALGVAVMNTYYKLAYPQAEKLLEHLGHEKIEAVFQKVLVG